MASRSPTGRRRTSRGTQPTEAQAAWGSSWAVAIGQERPRARAADAAGRRCESLNGILLGDPSSVPQGMTQPAPCIRLVMEAYYFSTSGETRGSGPGNLGGQPKVPSRAAGAGREMWPHEPEATKLSG